MGVRRQLPSLFSGWPSRLLTLLQVRKLKGLKLVSWWLYVDESDLVNRQPLISHFFKHVSWHCQNNEKNTYHMHISLYIHRHIYKWSHNTFINPLSNAHCKFTSITFSAWVSCVSLLRQKTVTETPSNRPKLHLNISEETLKSVAFPNWQVSFLINGCFWFP